MPPQAESLADHFAANLTAGAEQFNLALHQAKRLVVGFSGGVDSTVLLHLAQQFCIQINKPILALHANHKLSAQAENWVAHCHTICEGYAIPLQVQTLDISKVGNLEANARVQRYQFFEQVLEAGDVLLLGHHANDQLETVLLRLFSGRGLFGMQDYTQLEEHVVLRPLIDVERIALERYAIEHNLEWIEDESNQDVQFDRNYLRSQLIPQVVNRWPQVSTAAQRVAADSQAQWQALQNTLQQLLLQSPDLSVDLKFYPSQALEAVVWLRALLACFGEYTVADRNILNFVHHINDVHAQLQAQHGVLRIFQGRLHYVSNTLLKLCDFESQPVAVGTAVQTVVGTLTFEEVTILKSEKTQNDAICVDWDLTVKPRKGGERIFLGEQSVQIKNLLHQAGLPPWKRQGYPLIYQHDQVICVPGIATTPFVLSEGTKKGQWVVPRLI